MVLQCACDSSGRIRRTHPFSPRWAWPPISRGENLEEFVVIGVGRGTGCRRDKLEAPMLPRLLDPFAAEEPHESRIAKVALKVAHRTFHGIGWGPPGRGTASSPVQWHVVHTMVGDYRFPTMGQERHLAKRTPTWPMLDCLSGLNGTAFRLPLGPERAPFGIHPSRYCRQVGSTCQTRLLIEKSHPTGGHHFLAITASPARAAAG